MPMPEDPQTPWPPAHMRTALADYRKWEAWWSGDPDRLHRVYNATHVTDALDTSTGGAGTISRMSTGAATRTFWGTAPSAGTSRAAKLHVPLAADIAVASADLLFAEPPALVVPDAARRTQLIDTTAASPTQERLDLIADNGGLYPALLEAGELAAAFGGVFLRVGWDPAVADHVLFDVVPADGGVPEFRSGRLTAVLFFRDLTGTGDSRTWRHLELHSPGRVTHALYATRDHSTIGRRMDLRDHPETELLGRSTPSGVLETGSDGLTAEYVPNMRPHRRSRESYLGRSDFDGIEGQLDALDEAWTSWMRDLRLGKARLLVPESYLENLGRGRGAAFDPEAEIYNAMNMLPRDDASAFQQIQFNIRVAEHEQTTTALTVAALRGAGYSAQTFGLSGDVAATATEVVARERRSYVTRAKKIGYWRPVLRRLALAALQVDQRQFGPDGVVPELPDIEWPDGVSVDPAQMAQTIAVLETAKAISTETKVGMLHPDWDAERIAAEVARIDGAGMPPEPPGGPTPPAPVPAAVDAAPQAGPPPALPASGNRAGGNRRAPFAPRRPRLPTGP